MLLFVWIKVILSWPKWRGWNIILYNILYYCDIVQEHNYSCNCDDIWFSVVMVLSNMLGNYCSYAVFWENMNDVISF